MANIPAEQASSGGNILAPDVLMVVLTWITFFILLAILKKFAWKPILEGLQKREDYIRSSLEDADKAKAHMVEIEAAKAKILDEAKSQAAQIIHEARSAARNLAIEIEHKAKANAQSIVESAQGQIRGEHERVRLLIKKESADIAISLAGKIIKENTDTAKNRQLIAAAIDQI